MKRLFGTSLVFGLLLFTLGHATTAFSQPVAGFGTPSAAVSPELRQLDYLIGLWTVHSFTRNDDGQFAESPYATSSYRARYLYDGLSILAEFFGENRDGFYGVHVISHDPDVGLIHNYFNARAGRRLEFSGAFRNKKYYLSRPGGYSGKDAHYREVDSEIQDDSFIKRIFTSEDGGETWVEGDYYFSFERVK